MEKKTPTESYTVITTDLRDPIMMRLEFFVDREKMREFLAEYAERHQRCVVVPGPVDDVDYQVEYESDQKTIKSIHFEDEPGYKPPFDLLKVRNGEFVSVKEDAEFRESINKVVTDIVREDSEQDS